MKTITVAVHKLSKKVSGK